MTENTNSHNPFSNKGPKKMHGEIQGGKMLHFKRMGRELAMQYLFQCDITGVGSDNELKENFWVQVEESGEFPTNRVFRKARNYAEKIIAGVTEHESDIDKTIESFSEKWDIERMPAVDRNIMRVAIYELKYSPDIPALVSIDEAIEIAKDFSSDKSGLFINGILNGVKDSLPKNAKLSSGVKAKDDDEDDE